MRSLLRDLSKSVYFLDYDGTLCPHLEVWEGVGYNPQDIQVTVQNLARKSLGVWWNTGRRTESLQAVNNELIKYPGFFVQGSVYWNPIEGKKELIGKELPQSFVTALSERMRSEESHYRLEIKPTAARVASFRKTQKKYLRKFVDSLGIEIPSGWEWRIGDRGAEFLLKNCSKGSALQYAFENRLVARGSIPVVAGDDVFDRPAMEFALQNGGYAILVGEGCGWITEIPHRSSQVVFFREPKDFLQFLKLA